jgi:type II secretory ATPase GspE/PulE/Tfp pilus assembly ATPase PilB-like protein
VTTATLPIFEAAVRGGMTTLRQDGLRLCLEGVSSLDEIRRVTGERLA